MHGLAEIRKANTLPKTVDLQHKIETLEGDWKKLRTALVEIRQRNEMRMPFQDHVIEKLIADVLD